MRIRYVLRGTRKSSPSEFLMVRKNSALSILVFADRFEASYGLSGSLPLLGSPRVDRGDFTPIWPRNGQLKKIESSSRVSWVALAFNADGWYLRVEFGFDALPQRTSTKGTVDGYLTLCEARR